MQLGEMRLRVALLASTLGIAPLCADQATPTALSWHRLPGAEACPGLKDVAARVIAHLQRDPFAAPSSASAVIEATIAPAPNGWTTQIDYSSTLDANATGQRKLESTEPECGAAVDAAALAIALMIDPNALTSGPATEPTPPLVEPQPEPPPAAERERREAPPRWQATAPCEPQAPLDAPWRTRLAAGAVFGLGQVPSATGGGWLGWRLSPAERRLGLELAFAYLAAREARVRAGAGGEFSSLSVSGSAFWAPLRARAFSLSAVGGVELGRILASGFGFQSFRSEGAWTLAPTADLELSVAVGPRWEILFRLGGGVALLRPRYEFDLNGVAQPIFQPTPVFGRAAVGVAFGP